MDIDSVHPFGRGKRDNVLVVVVLVSRKSSNSCRDLLHIVNAMTGLRMKNLSCVIFGFIARLPQGRLDGRASSFWLLGLVTVDTVGTWCCGGNSASLSTAHLRWSHGSGVRGTFPCSAVGWVLLRSLKKLVETTGLP